MSLSPLLRRWLPGGGGTDGTGPEDGRGDPALAEPAPEPAPAVPLIRAVTRIDCPATARDCPQPGRCEILGCLRLNADPFAPRPEPEAPTPDPTPPPPAALEAEIPSMTTDTIASSLATPAEAAPVPAAPKGELRIMPTRGGYIAVTAGGAEGLVVPFGVAADPQGLARLAIEWATQA